MLTRKIIEKVKENKNIKQDEFEAIEKKYEQNKTNAEAQLNYAFALLATNKFDHNKAYGILLK
ncbi:MAG: hypothetical protein CL512_05490 [Actinobacteria bacterium]|nr:hypothetical protein [Actinomycetota bacterium]|tara:strand:+ start:102 stop:290 length:189 start_codon:yes stop_codon:yes gene_type:complete